MKQPLSIFTKGLLFGTGILVASGIVLAATYANISQVPAKGPGDMITASEFNSIVETLEGFNNIDGNIGLGITPDTNFKLSLDGNLNGKDLYGNDFWASNGFWYTSDRNLKTNIKKLNNYENILNINSVNFNWKDSGKNDIGVIAQDVEQYFPEFVHANSSGIKSVDYAKLVVPLMAVVKDLSVKLETQESEITNLKKELAVIHKELELNKIKK